MRGFPKIATFALALLLLPVGCASAPEPPFAPPAGAPMSAEAPLTAPPDPRYGRSFLSSNEKAVYDQLEGMALSYRTGESVPPLFPLKLEQFQRICGYLMDDNPLCYWMQLSCTIDAEGIVTAFTSEAAAPLTAEAAKEREREIARAADLLLAGAEKNSFSAVVQAHDALLQKMSYDRTNARPTGRIYTADS